MNAKDRKRAEHTIKAVAQKEGISVAEVRKEMNLAIAAAYKRAKEIHSPAWDAWDRPPTAEEFILWISENQPSYH